MPTKRPLVLAAGACFAVAVALALVGGWHWLIGRSQPQPQPLPPLPASVGFADVDVTITGGGGSRVRCVLLADTDARRQRGLMEVTDPALNGHAGMLFVFPADTRDPFWMRDTPIPLSIAWLDSSGRLVSSADMAPCGRSAHCPLYPPAAAYRSAIEVPQGRLADLGLRPGSVMKAGATRCGAGLPGVELPGLGPLSR